MPAHVGGSRYIGSMDALLWVGWICTLVVLFFMATIGLFGALALKAPTWDLEFLALAHYEWKRRGLIDRDHSMSEELHMQRFIGQKQEALEPDVEARKLTVRTIAVLIGTDDHDTLASQLDKLSSEFLLSALISVFNSVENISNLNVASRVWVIRRWIALSIVLCRGLCWFLPKCFKQASKVIERYMTTATILGIAGGLLFWGFSRDLSESSEGGIEWVNFVGIVVTVGTVFALVVSVGQQFWQVTLALVGPIRTWTKRGILTAGIIAGFTAGMFTLIRTGTWTQWQHELNSSLTELLTGTPVGDWTEKALLVAAFIFAIYRALQWARARQLKVGDRVTALSVAIVLILMGTIITLSFFSAPHEAVIPFIYATALALAIFGLLEMILRAAEWIRKYRTLRNSGIEIRHGWFRWWILWAWSGTVIVLPIIASLPSHTHAMSSTLPFYLPISVLVPTATLVATLAFWPGVFIVARFVIRVHNTYARHEFETAKTQFSTELESKKTGDPGGIE